MKDNIPNNIQIPDKFILDGIEPNMIQWRNLNKAILTIHADGRITVAEHLKPTETAAEVLKIMREQWMADAQATKIREQEDRIKRLEEWKDSAMAVEREWDANAISTMLGGQLGESQRVVIMREVPRLLERIKRLEEALGLVVPHCSWVHHSKKHQHKYGEPCPVVALIEKAKKAK